jgi:hypothetical protein
VFFWSKSDFSSSANGLRMCAVKDWAAKKEFAVDAVLAQFIAPMKSSASMSQRSGIRDREGFVMVRIALLSGMLASSVKGTFFL